MDIIGNLRCERSELCRILIKEYFIFVVECSVVIELSKIVNFFIIPQKLAKNKGGEYQVSGIKNVV